MENAKIFYHPSDYEQFQRWINLNLEGLTWQGRYHKEFEEFWSLFFIDGLSLAQVIERFNYGYSESKIGPLASWFKWLKEKFLNYTFIHVDITLYELSKESGIPLPDLASILRNFFIEAFPHLEEYFTSSFQIGNVASRNLDISYKKILSDVKISQDFLGSQSDEIMPGLEVTLYEEWRLFLKKLKKDLYYPSFNFKSIRAGKSFGTQLKFLAEFLILVVLGIGLVYAIQHVNRLYERYLADKISIYEPEFTWLDKTLTFEEQGPRRPTDFNLELKDIENVADAKFNEANAEDEARFEPESEVILTSADALPRDFGAADLEQSSYEEITPGGYRDNRFGNKKVYRVMMKSVDPFKSRSVLNKLMDEFKVTQVDNVKPGLYVPGGIYYNLYVPREHLKDFLAKVMQVDEATLFESRTERMNPQGKNKVFIWIKSF